MGWRVGASVLCFLLFVAFGLQLIGCVSVPATKPIFMADRDGYKYGVWGTCKSDGSDCSSVGIGYTLHNEDSWYLGSSSQKILTKLLLVHTIAAVILLITWIMSFGLLKRNRGFVVTMIVATLISFIGALFSFIVEILLFREYLKWPGYLSVGSIVLTIFAFIGLMVMSRRSKDDSRGEIVVGPFGGDQEEEKLIKPSKFVPPARQQAPPLALNSLGPGDTKKPSPQPRTVPRTQYSSSDLAAQRENKPSQRVEQTTADSQLPRPNGRQKMPVGPQPRSEGTQNPRTFPGDRNETPGGPRIPAGAPVPGMDDDRPYSASVISAYASRPDPSTPNRAEETPQARATPEGRPIYGVTHSDSQHAMIDYMGDNAAANNDGPGARRIQRPPNRPETRQTRPYQAQLQPPVEPIPETQPLDEEGQTPLDWYLSNPPQHGQNAYFEPPVTQYAYNVPPSPESSEGSHYTSISQRAPPMPMVMGPMMPPAGAQPMFSSYPAPVMAPPMQAMAPPPMPGMAPGMAPAQGLPKPSKPNRSELALDTNPDFSIGPVGRRRRPGGGFA